MRKKTVSLVAIGFAVAGLVVGLSGSRAQARGNGNPHGIGVIYVTSQNLFFDTQVVVDPLPNEGPFQELEPGAGPGGVSQTDYGPGGPGYVGGRWWVDVNNNNEMDSEDHYFLCPLLGPGRPTP